MLLGRRWPWQQRVGATRARLRLLHDRSQVGSLDAAYRLVLGAGPEDAVEITPAQTAAVKAALDGYSVFLQLPTGAGKSLAFQVPAIMAANGATTLVVSPLIALMQDQVANLKRKGIDALCLSGDMAELRGSRKKPLSSLLQGHRLVYSTPEFVMQNRAMQAWLVALGESQALSRIVFDEAHCVLEWGNTFRPHYLELCRWKTRYFPHVPVTLTTATVSDGDIPQLADIFRTRLVTRAQVSKKDSRAEDMVLIQSHSDRPNLRLEIIHKNPTTAPFRIHERVGDHPTIVYCLTRKEAEELCLELVRLGCKAGLYHGGVPRRRRDFVQKQWMAGQLSIICATSAFGMGIDRPDVRFVIHHSIPLSLAAYYQQIGRAGRDGHPATCVLFYSAEDKSRAHAVTMERVDDSTGEVLSAGGSYSDVEGIASFCETTDCRRAWLAAHFGTSTDDSDCTHNCNCGPVPSEDLGHDHLEPPHAVSLAEDTSTSDDDPSRMEIEVHYQRVLAEARRQGLPKREALSRRAVAEVLRVQPSSDAEMALVRGVGLDKAVKYFSVFSFSKWRR